MSQGKEVTVTIATQQEQGGQSSDYKQTFEGQCFQMGETLYLRYNEDQDTQVTFKFAADGTVMLTRKKKNGQRLQLVFDGTKPVKTNKYHTPYGVILITTETSRLEFEKKDGEFAGSLAVDYALSQQGNRVGNYKLRLQFEN